MRRSSAFQPFFVFRALSFFLLISFFPISTASANEIINGEFSNGLNSWIISGNTLPSNNEALLGDGGGCGQACASLFQVVNLSAGDYTLSFDFMNGLSRNVPQGSFPDTLFASIYYTNNSAGFNPTDPGTFTTGAGLFDINFNGATNLLSGVLIGPSAEKGAGWQHLFLNFTVSALQGVGIVFEYFNQNGIAADSTFRVDNVIINSQTAVVPEPCSALLLSFGVGGLLRRRKRVLTR